MWHHVNMKKGSTLFLRFILCAAAVAALIALLVFPQREGRAQGLGLISIYADRLIIYSYIASIPFFIGLHQAYRLLDLIDANKAFTHDAICRLKNIKIASLSMIGAVAAAIIFVRFFAQGDDPAGPTTLGIMLIMVFGVIATAAALFQRLFQNALDLKLENDLTI